MTLVRRPLNERFAEKTVPGLNGCVLWSGFIHRNGYGQFSEGNTKLLAHRAAWFVAYGVWPAGVVMHRCDNPTCVNIDHLSVGTHKDNTQDARAKGRLAPTKLNAVQVTAIKRRYAAGRVTQKQLTSEYAVAQNSIHKIVSGKSWAHI